MVNTYEWKEDQKRPLTCYDYVRTTGSGFPYGYVIIFKFGDNKWHARTNFLDIDAAYGTVEEAKAVVEAVIAMHNN